MPSTMEFEARSIEKALKKAAEALSCSEQELNYEIVSYGSTGIFGLVGAKKARIQVFLPDDTDKNTNKNNILEDFGVTGAPSETAAQADRREAVAGGAAESADERMEPAQALALGREALQTILDAVTTDARIVDMVESADGEEVVFKVEGGNAAVLIGKRGQTLDAIQYLVEKIVNRNSRRRLRLQVDIEGYLENRRRNLENLALRLAQKAVKSGKPMTIGQLKPQERRVVHVALKADPGVRTQSVGDGLIRKLVIIPRKNREPLRNVSNPSEAGFE